MEEENNNLEMIHPDTIREKRVVGAGGFGTVYRAHHADWGDVALKSLSTTFIEKRMKEKLVSEAKKLHRLSHPNIVQMLGLVMSEPCYAIVMEYVPYGSLNNFLDKYQTSWVMKMHFVEGIVLAMNFLHTRSSPIIHMDLKPPNVLVGRDFGVKVCDFGLSLWRSYSETYPGNSIRRGTLTHIPPEMWLNIGLQPTTAYDIYSFAILLWEVCTQEIPYQGVPHALIQEGVKTGQRPSLERLPADTPPVFRAIMEDCWDQEPTLRPGFNIIKDTLHENTSRRGVDMEKERLYLMQQIAADDLEVDAPPQVDQPPDGASPHRAPPGVRQQERVNGFHMTSEGRPLAREVLAEYPASTSLSGRLGPPVPQQNTTAAQPQQVLDRPTQRYVQPQYPASSDFTRHQLGENAVWDQAQPLHLNTFVEPEVDGVDSAPTAEVSLGPGMNARIPEVTPGRQQHPLGSGSCLPHDTEPDAEPDSLQSLNSPPEPQPTVFESYSRTGNGVPPSGRQDGASHSGSYSHSAPQGPPPNQSLPNFMKSFLPKFNVEMPDLSKCNSFVVHQKGGQGTTVICNSDKGKGANNIQVGDNNVMYVGTGARPAVRSGHPGPAAPKVSRDKATRSTRMIDDDNMELVSKHLGKYWKALGRKLGFSSGELDQINADYHVDGLEEKIRQMLERWRVKEGGDASLTVLVDKLWAVDQYRLALLIK